MATWCCCCCHWAASISWNPYWSKKSLDCARVSLSVQIVWGSTCSALMYNYLVSFLVATTAPMMMIMMMTMMISSLPALSILISLTLSRVHVARVQVCLAASAYSWVCWSLLGVVGVLLNWRERGGRTTRMKKLVCNVIWEADEIKPKEDEERSGFNRLVEALVVVVAVAGFDFVAPGRRH